MRAVLLALIVALGGCTNIVLPADPAEKLDPIAFFSGRSHGNAVLKVAFASPRRVTVESFGTREGDVLLLRQAIREEGKAPRWREWRIRPVGPGRYTGTLTDAEGPVTITVQGPRGLIRYRMKTGMAVEQQLALQPGGRTLLNHMVVTKWGVRVARLDETIRKLP